MCETLIPQVQNSDTVSTVRDIVTSLDPLALTCLFKMTQSSKSAAISLCTLYGHLTVEQAVKAARTDENFQIEKFGLVEGAHDLDETNLYTTFTSAKTIVNLAQLRDI